MIRSISTICAVLLLSATGTAQAVVHNKWHQLASTGPGARSGQDAR